MSRQGSTKTLDFLVKWILIPLVKMPDRNRIFARYCGRRAMPRRDLRGVTCRVLPTSSDFRPRLHNLSRWCEIMKRRQQGVAQNWQIGGCMRHIVDRALKRLKRYCPIGRLPPRDRQRVASGTRGAWVDSSIGVARNDKCSKPVRPL